MEINQTGNDIKQAFDAMAGGVKEAGRKRTAEIVAKNGYVAFKNPDAVAKFHADPYYASWSCTFIDGEYRFYPPRQKSNHSSKEKSISNDENIQKKSNEDLQLLEVYKQVIADPTQTTFVSVSALQNDRSKCKYELISIDKRTGERKKIQEAIVDFNGKFSMEILPSIYNQLTDGFPAIDYEKEQKIMFQNVNNNKVMGFGNLSTEQLQLIKNMKAFVDNKYMNHNQEEIAEFHR